MILPNVGLAESLTTKPYLLLESLANLKANMEYTILEKGEVQIKGVCN